MASWGFTHTFIKYLTYDNVPTKLLMGTGGGGGAHQQKLTKSEGSKS